MNTKRDGSRLIARCHRLAKRCERLQVKTREATGTPSFRQYLKEWDQTARRLVLLSLRVARLRDDKELTLTINGFIQRMIDGYDLAIQQRIQLDTQEHKPVPCLPEHPATTPDIRLGRQSPPDSAQS
jgi:hypothetical protein